MLEQPASRPATRAKANLIKCEPPDSKCDFTAAGASQRAGWLLRPLLARLCRLSHAADPPRTEAPAGPGLQASAAVDPCLGSSKVFPRSESEARKESPVFARRESKRRALLKLVDRVSLRPAQPFPLPARLRRPSAPPPPATRRSPS